METIKRYPERYLINEYEESKNQAVEISVDIGLVIENFDQAFKRKNDTRIILESFNDLVKKQRTIINDEEKMKFKDSIVPSTKQNTPSQLNEEDKEMKEDDHF